MLKLFKKGKQVTDAKPENSAEWLPFEIDTDLITKDDASHFLMYVVADIKEINAIKIDVGFMVNERLKPPSKRFTVHTPGTIFYIWVRLPDHEALIPYDVFHFPRILTAKEMESARSFLLRHTDALLYFRNLYETPQVPAGIRPLQVYPGRL